MNLQIMFFPQFSVTFHFKKMEFLKMVLINNLLISVVGWREWQTFRSGRLGSDIGLVHPPCHFTGHQHAESLLWRLQV